MNNREMNSKSSSLKTIPESNLDLTMENRDLKIHEEETQINGIDFMKLSIN